MSNWLSINGIISYTIFINSNKPIEDFEPNLQKSVLKGLEGRISSSKHYVFKETNQSSISYAFSGDIRLRSDENNIFNSVKDWLYLVLKEPKKYVEVELDSNDYFSISIHSCIFEFNIDETNKYIVKWDTRYKEFYILNENEFLREVLLNNSK